MLKLRRPKKTKKTFQLLSTFLS